MEETILQIAEKHAREEVLSILRKCGVGVNTFEHEVDQDGYHVHRSIVDPASPVAIEWWFGEESNGTPIYGMDLLVRDPMISTSGFAGFFRVERMFDFPYHDWSGWHYKLEGIVTPHLDLPAALRAFGDERSLLSHASDHGGDFIRGHRAEALISSAARFFLKRVAR